jgi:hypothetical protein
MSRIGVPSHPAALQMGFGMGLPGGRPPRLSGVIVAELTSGWLGMASGNHLAQWFRILEALSRLAPGWNRQGAPAPSEESIRAARQFIVALVNDGQPPTRVAASAIGGVGVTRRVGERMAYIEFCNNGTACALMADDAADERVLDVAPERGTFRGLLDEVKAYLHG